ncbi:hypothetical protein [Nocardia sp. NPDC052566]|uniref:hypothetical protein n=1 Tax=Nocardia sp. NPDC052566 TaxID=3364330 RepID=UPI0037C53F4D
MTDLILIITLGPVTGYSRRFHAELRRRCRRRLAEAGLLGAGDSLSACAEFASRSGRPIVSSAITMPSNSMHAMLVRTTDIDYIVYERDTTRLHQQHIIAHELGHLIWNHRGIAEFGDGQEIVAVLGRGNYDPVEELEAEVTATLLLERQRSVLGRPVGSDRARAMGEALGFESARR